MKKEIFGRDIFLTGEYIKHFKPDSKRNPFFKIYRQKKQDTIDIINKSKEPKIILDVGGGIGRLSLTLAELTQNKVVLADISFYMLELTVKQTTNLNNIELVNADAHQLPFRDKSFNYIVGLDLLCHLKKPERTLLEFHRVLAGDGILIVDSTNSNPLWTIFYPRYLGKNPLNWFKIIKFKGVYPGWENIVKHYPHKKFLSLLQGGGFKVIQNLNYGPSICPKWHLAVAEKIS